MKVYSLNDNIDFLNKLVNDTQYQKDVYMPGPYWKEKTRNSTNQIKLLGLSDFRGLSSSIGLSFADNIYVDTRMNYNGTIKAKVLKFILDKVYPFKKTFDSQVRLTESYAQEMLKFKSENLLNNPRTKQLISKYNIPYSILGGCIDYIDIEGAKISTHYLDLLDQLDNANKYIDFSKAQSIFEIGGGFGANIHLILENFQNIKKIIYLDIPPNLYTGTQYLRTFYGDAVKDYNETHELNEISFKKNNDLEILAIAPWQIEKIKAEINIVYNSHSFVEMPTFVVKNYVEQLEKLDNSKHTTNVLISYDGFDQSTINPDTLPSFFNIKKFNKYIFPSLINNQRSNFYYISG